MPSPVLIIDSTHAILETMELVLQDAGYHVILSAEGLPPARIAILNPALVIIEDWLHMQQPGRELCKALKNYQPTSHIPVLLMSTSHILDSIIKGAGANGAIYKPFDIEELSDLISLTLRQHIA